MTEIIPKFRHLSDVLQFMGFEGSMSLSQFASLGEGDFSSAGPASRFVVLRGMLVGEGDLNSDSWLSEVWTTILGALTRRKLGKIGWTRRVKTI